eukprot:1830603-Amphidinium_carterae.1
MGRTPAGLSCPDSCNVSGSFRAKKVLGVNALIKKNILVFGVFQGAPNSRVPKANRAVPNFQINSPQRR